MPLKTRVRFSLGPNCIDIPINLFIGIFFYNQYLMFMNKKLYNLLKIIIKEQLINEIGIEELENLQYCNMASSHSLKTCKINGDDFYLKFGGWGGDSIERQHEYNLQIGVEYIAYQIYKLFGIKTPKEIHIISNKKDKSIGIATQAIQGKRFSRTSEGQKSLTKGMFVDMFLENWDIGNTSNLIQTDSDVVRIDPGGALVFRAQGERKGEKFGNKPGELETMHPKNKISPAASLYDKESLYSAAQIFERIEKNTIMSRLDLASEDVIEALKEAEFGKENITKWNSIVEEIKQKLSNRYDAILSSIEFIEANK